MLRKENQSCFLFHFSFIHSFCWNGKRCFVRCYINCFLFFATLTKNRRPFSANFVCHSASSRLCNNNNSSSSDRKINISIWTRNLKKKKKKVASVTLLHIIVYKQNNLDFFFFFSLFLFLVDSNERTRISLFSQEESTHRLKWKYIFSLSLLLLPICATVNFNFIFSTKISSTFVWKLIKKKLFH